MHTIKILFYSFKLNDKNVQCAMLNQMRASLKTKELIFDGLKYFI